MRWPAIEVSEQTCFWWIFLHQLPLFYEGILDLLSSNRTNATLRCRTTGSRGAAYVENDPIACSHRASLAATQYCIALPPGLYSVACWPREPLLFPRSETAFQVQLSLASIGKSIPEAPFRWPAIPTA